MHSLWEWSVYGSWVDSWFTLESAIVFHWDGTGGMSPIHTAGRSSFFEFGWVRTPMVLTTDELPGLALKCCGDWDQMRCLGVGPGTNEVSPNQADIRNTTKINMGVMCWLWYLNKTSRYLAQNQILSAQHIQIIPFLSTLPYLICKLVNTAKKILFLSYNVLYNSLFNI